MRFSSRSARQLALGASLLGVASLTACNKDGGDFAKTKSGIEYKIFKKVGNDYERREINPDGDPTYKDRVGKFLLGNMQYRTGKDSVLQNTRRDVGLPVPLPLQEIKTKGAPDEALSLLQPGDSGVFRFQVDSLIKPSSGQPVPPFLKRGGNVVMMYVATTPKLITQEEAQAMQPELQKRAMASQMKQRMASPEYAKQMKEQADAQAKAMAAPEVVAQLKKDDAILQEYAKKNSLTVQKLPSGVYYQVLKPGTGPKPQPGQTVSVNYNGTLLSGKLFDSSDKAGKPIDFPIGQGAVIPGWDQGIAQLNKGSKAILLIPSSLAYGTRGAGADIPADAPLRFEVELVDIQ
ncbi:FKBP-type peptidyl-prolyl cis-trans isomerase [Hymenobacter arizonensis]|uniref:peptidylprolyl isomerase n=1 Tax=Hymenobacter arizonensis TaxID=1227077 RepID=A0A1I5ZIR0_HYMAR|nr:FKBP-type peptidyl-prolyl cis-trans isomerase [Hymenobacter arizonensis]SFQ56338.1 FKBP-type peptidyl-prolyl cis-trans isomerase [Hymenobacter arizonensis]